MGKAILSFFQPITTGERVSADPDRALVDAWLEKHPVTVCPPDRRVAPKKPAPKSGIAPDMGNPVSDTPRIRATDRSGPSSAPRVMSIQQALEWAFITECAQVDFDEYGAHEFDSEGIDPLWRGMKMAELGCAVDGGGSSPPHPAAQVIASYVEALPIEHGGRKMALQIVELARARSVPQWHVPVRVDPCGDQVVKSMDREGIWTFTTECRHRRAVRGEYCPIVITGGARATAAARRNYLLWCSAILHLWSRLCGRWLTIEINDVLPPPDPWNR